MFACAALDMAELRAVVCQQVSFLQPLLELCGCAHDAWGHAPPLPPSPRERTGWDKRTKSSNKSAMQYVHISVDSCSRALNIVARIITKEPALFFKHLCLELVALGFSSLVALDVAGRFAGSVTSGRSSISAEILIGLLWLSL